MGFLATIQSERHRKGRWEGQSLFHIAKRSRVTNGNKNCYVLCSRMGFRRPQKRFLSVGERWVGGPEFQNCYEILCGNGNSYCKILGGDSIKILPRDFGKTEIYSQ